MEVEQIHSGIAGTVHYDRIIQVKLHGHTIARFYPATDTFTVSDAGRQTTTTKSRINALLSVFSPAAGRVYSKAFEWYFGDSDWSGEVTPAELKFSVRGALVSHNGRVCLPVLEPILPLSTGEPYNREPVPILG
jgi:hypothetical protein